MIVIMAWVLFYAAGCEEYELEIDEPEVTTTEASEPETDELIEYIPVSAAFELVKDMKIGWCLGNTLDSIDNKKIGILNNADVITPEEHYETYWGNPVTTVEMINAVADAGFGAIRIPVTYTDHMDEGFTIREEWLLRVEQIVKYAFDNDLYCIINIHHDTGHGSWPWLKADPDNLPQLEERLRTVWTQIAGHFREYGEKLLFESFNEILDMEDRWGGADIKAYYAVNWLNQAFVDAVRKTGGNNANRFLIVKTYAAGVAADLINAFVLPADSAEDRLIAGVHYYGTLPFAWKQSQVSWTDAYSDWDRLRDGNPVEAVMKRLNDSFIEKGIPVIIGEFGAQNKNNENDRAEYAAHYVETAKQYGITCFWWDDGGQFDNAEAVGNFALLDRINVRWFFPEINSALIDASLRSPR